MHLSSVGSLPLAKNALHSPTSNMYIVFVFVREREREREWQCVREIKYQNGSLASQTHSLGGGRESGNTPIVKSCNGFLIIFRKHKCGS